MRGIPKRVGGEVKSPPTALRREHPFGKSAMKAIGGAARWARSQARRYPSSKVGSPDLNREGEEAPKGLSEPGRFRARGSGPAKAIIAIDVQEAGPPRKGIDRNDRMAAVPENKRGKPRPSSGCPVPVEL
jgi:hypothetical protein